MNPASPSIFSKVILEGTQFNQTNPLCYSSKKRLNPQLYFMQYMLLALMGDKSIFVKYSENYLPGMESSL